MQIDDRRERYDRLPPRTRELVELLIRRPELTIRDVAVLLSMSVNNARTRLTREVYPSDYLGVENRVHLVAEYQEVIGPKAK